MKVAVCLSGQSRFTRENFDSIYDSLIAPTKADVFFHHWDTEDVRLGMYPQEALELYRPRKHIIEPQKVWDVFQWDDVLSVVGSEESQEIYRKKLQRVHSMHYSLFTANRLRKQYEEENGFIYDCVIRARTDLLFGHPFSMEEFRQDPQALWVWFIRDRGPAKVACCDLFAFGSSQTMDLYSDFYHNLVPQVYKSRHLFIESLLYEYLVGLQLCIRFSKTLKAKHDRRVLVEQKFTTGDDRVPDHPIIKRPSDGNQSDPI